MKITELKSCDSFACAKITNNDNTGFNVDDIVNIAPIADVLSETRTYNTEGAFFADYKTTEEV